MATARAKGGPKPGEWQFTVGEVPNHLTAYERTDKGLRIYTRVWNGKSYRDKRALCAPIRDERGRIDPEKEQAARDAALERQRRAAAGREEPTRRERANAPLTLRRAFDLYLDPTEGKFAAPTPWSKEAKRASATIFAALGDDSNMLVAELRHAHYRTVWRYMAAEYRRAGVGGIRWTEQVVGVVQTLVRWLQVEERLEGGVGTPAPGWKTQMRAEWEQITGAPILDGEQPRYTAEELEALFRALPDDDPRLWVACEIGAELRLGQVARSRRSDVLPSRDGHPLGIVRVHGRGKKLGETVVLDGVQRATLYYHLHHGYLRDLERAYQAGKLADYHLFPGGHLLEWGRSSRHEERNGHVVIALPVAQVANAGRHWTDTGMRKAWRRLELAADVEHVDGRAWYGLRRVQTDRAEDVEQDPRVLRHLGGWKNDETRRRYQQRGRMDLVEKASATRAKIRPGRD